MSKFSLDTDRPIKVTKNLPDFIEGRLPDDVTDEYGRRDFFMGEALKLARRALSLGEVPVGCVIVRHNEIIAAGFNRRESEKCATYHAEISAIEDACKALGGWRLVSCELYVTLEPCPMCAGAIMNARIPSVFIGARDSKSGAYGGLYDINSFGVNHKPSVTFGVLENECASVLKNFFIEKRSR